MEVILSADRRERIAIPTVTELPLTASRGERSPRRLRSSGQALSALAPQDDPVLNRLTNRWNPKWLAYKSVCNWNGLALIEVIFPASHHHGRQAVSDDVE